MLDCKFVRMNDKNNSMINLNYVVSITSEHIDSNVPKYIIVVKYVSGNIDKIYYEASNKHYFDIDIRKLSKLSISIT